MVRFRTHRIRHRPGRTILVTSLHPQKAAWRQPNRLELVPILWRGAASALVKPWPPDAAQGVVSIAAPEPDSGSLALQAMPLQASFLDPNRFYIKGGGRVRQPTTHDYACELTSGVSGRLFFGNVGSRNASACGGAITRVPSLRCSSTICEWSSFIFVQCSFGRKWCSA